MENDRDILLVAIFTFITVCSWIFFELVKTVKTSTVDVQTKEIVRSIKPFIDLETLNKLDSRTIYK